MKVKIIALILVFSANTIVYGQGINFENGLSWADVLAKAKKENKYVFLDCFATWCGPCKKMEAEVFNDSSVGTVMNKNFISVRFQMDSTNKDSKETRMKFRDAKFIENEFEINSYPSLLFFSPQGKLLHKSGYQDIAGFLSTIKLALDSGRNLVGLEHSFLNRKMDSTALLSYLALLKKSRKTEESLKVATYFKNLYLNNMPLDSLLDKGRLNFIISNPTLLSSNDNFFRLFYKRGFEVNTLMKKNRLAENLVDYVIMSEEINPMILRDGKFLDIIPAWSKYYKTIKNKYSVEIAQRLINSAKFSWYYEKKDWKAATANLIQTLDANNWDKSAFGLTTMNTHIYNLIFKTSNDKKQLNKGIKWMEYIIKQYPDIYAWLDTYASLLYKAGRVKEGIDWEEKALKLATDKKDQENAVFFEKILQRMKNREKIWEN